MLRILSASLVALATLASGTASAGDCTGYVVNLRPISQYNHASGAGFLAVRTGPGSGYQQILWKNTRSLAQNAAPRMGRACLFVRLFAVAAVQEGAWPVSGGSGRWRRGGIRHLRRMGRVIAIVPTREYV